MKIPTVHPRAVFPVLFPLLLLTACGDGSGVQQRTTLGMEAAAEVALPPELQLQLDAGNESFRAGDFEAALAHFAEATRLDPDLAAAWYGIGMTETARGNETEADAAMMEVHRLNPEIPLEHPRAAAPPNPHVLPAPLDENPGSS
jgi:tetratricopeptide (TPR) repeat protein